MTENSPNSEKESSLSPGDFLNVSETTDAFMKTLDNLKEVVECKADIVIKRKEKHQQVLDKQIEKLRKEKEGYLSQSQYLAKEIPEMRKQLSEVEHSIDLAQTEYTLQLKLNKEIEEKIKVYESAIKKQHSHLSQVTRLVSMLVGYYKTYMGLTFDFEKDNPNIVIVSFENMKKNLSNGPFMKLEVISKNQFIFIECYPRLNEFDEYMDHTLEHHELVSLLYKFRQYIVGEFLEEGKQQLVTNEFLNLKCL